MYLRPGQRNRIERARADADRADRREIERADVILRLVDAAQGEGGDDDIDRRLPPAVERIIVVNKIDLVGLAAGRSEIDGRVRLQVSARGGEGVELVRRELLRIAGWHAHGEDVILARERHLLALRQALAHVIEAGGQLGALELFAEELRLAQEQLGEITGEFTADELLGVIFSRFCIGK